MSEQAQLSNFGDFVIRELSAADASACAAFAEHLDWHDRRMRFSSVNFSVRHFLPGADAKSGTTAFAAVAPPDAIIGIINLALVNSGCAELGLIVRSDHKRRGIGRALLSHGVGWSASNGLIRVVGLVLDENHAMRELARSMGFRSIRREGFHIEMSRSIDVT